MTDQENETILTECFNRLVQKFHAVVKTLHPTQDISEMIELTYSYASVFTEGKYRLNAILNCKNICSSILEYCPTNLHDRSVMEILMNSFNQMANAYRYEFCGQTD